MDSRTETKGRMPEKPAGVTESEWMWYKALATARQGRAARQELADTFGLPVIPADVLA